MQILIRVNIYGKFSQPVIGISAANRGLRISENHLSLRASNLRVAGVDQVENLGSNRRLAWRFCRLLIPGLGELHLFAAKALRRQTDSMPESPVLERFVRLKRIAWRCPRGRQFRS